jgi:hypothetical protein
MAIFIYEMYREVLMAFAGQCISILCTHTASLRKCCRAAVVPYYHGGIQAHRGNVLYIRSPRLSIMYNIKLVGSRYDLVMST